MVPYGSSNQQPRSRRRNPWSRRKKVAVLLVVLMFLAPFAAFGYYAWDITNTIENVQDQAVVDLPSSRAELGGVNQDENEPESSDANEDSTPQNAEDEQAPQVTVTKEPAETQEDSSRNNPSAIGVARDLFGTGTRTDVKNADEVWGRDFINVLVLGVDTREEEGDQNADVIMIARIDFTTNEVRVVSIPRDLQVEVPGHGLHKINGAYNIGVKEDPENEIGGVLMMRDTIEYNFSVPIDEFLLVDFAGFEEVIDSVGGITINVPERIEDEAFPTEDFGTTHLVIEAGVQEMDGETALAYARTRHQDSDDARRERQMLVLRSLLDKGQSLGSVTRITQVIQAAGGAVLTSIDWTEQLALVSVALSLNQNDIVMESITEPLVKPGTAENGAWIYVGDPTEIGTFIDDVLTGEWST